MGAKYIAFYENIGTGIQFNNIRFSPVEGDRFTCFETLLFMLADTFLHLFLMWYIENVFPGRSAIGKRKRKCRQSIHSFRIVWNTEEMVFSSHSQLLDREDVDESTLVLGQMAKDPSRQLASMSMSKAFDVL